MSTEIDRSYQQIVRLCLGGEKINARGHASLSTFRTPVFSFNRTPLVSLKKTAWKSALREWEWFMAGDVPCPAPLNTTWWDGQLGCDSFYHGGYGAQFRAFHGREGAFDQIEALVEGLIKHPHSRRHIITTWNPWDCANITKMNDNSATPTPCHNTIVQFFVRGASLSAFTYQRSADVLLGLPHNLIQFWAFMIWLAHRTQLVVDDVQWKLGDAHIYKTENHLRAASDIASAALVYEDFQPRLLYVPGDSCERFKADDFILIGRLPEPATNVKLELLI